MTEKLASIAPPGPRVASPRRVVGFIVIVVTLALLLPLSLFAQHKAPGSKAPGAKGGSDAVARGKYLVQIAGCNDCHTPLKMGPAGPEPDQTRLLSGHAHDMTMPPAPSLEMPWGWVGGAAMTAFAGPWGTSYSANLTPDTETGIGSWDEAMFMQTIRGGKIHTGTRPIMPPMPWQGIGTMTDRDLNAVFAYLKTLTPINNQVPQYLPANTPK